MDGKVDALSLFMPQSGSVLCDIGLKNTFVDRDMIINAEMSVFFCSTLLSSIQPEFNTPHCNIRVTGIATQ